MTLRQHLNKLLGLCYVFAMLRLWAQSKSRTKFLDGSNKNVYITFIKDSCSLHYGINSAINIELANLIPSTSHKKAKGIGFCCFWNRLLKLDITEFGVDESVFLRKSKYQDALMMLLSLITANWQTIYIVSIF